MERLDLGAVDWEFGEELAQEPGCQHLRRCFSCGVCTATCPVSATVPDFSPARILRLIFTGQRRRLLSSPLLWYCLRCARCSFQCPQDVRFLDIIQGLRHLALREGFFPAELAVRLEKAEALLQELRHRLIERLLTASEENPDLSRLLQELVADTAASLEGTTTCRHEP